MVEKRGFEVGIKSREAYVYSPCPNCGKLRWVKRSLAPRYCRSCANLKINLFLEARKHRSESKRGEKNPMYGFHYPEEERRKKSQQMRGSNNPMYGVHLKHTGATKELISEASKARWQNREYRERVGKAISEATKRQWTNLQSREKLLKAILKAIRKRPNKPEQQLIDLIEKSKLPFRYTGGGQLIIGGKCPDFINVNGKKQLIELFGVHWHPLFDVAERKEHYRQYGFDTLIIWEDELPDEEKVTRKIKKFLRMKEVEC